MKRFLSCLWIAAFALPMWAADIPDRPEKLKFPPLKYDPPTGSDYRVQLKSGPVVYLVPNRELPLVSISIRVRTGSFETPSGKEGLAELTGSLLTGTGVWYLLRKQLRSYMTFEQHPNLRIDKDRFYTIDDLVHIRTKIIASRIG